MLAFILDVVIAHACFMSFIMLFLFHIFYYIYVFHLVQEKFPLEDSEKVDFFLMLSDLKQLHDCD